MIFFHGSDFIETETLELNSSILWKLAVSLGLKKSQRRMCTLSSSDVMLPAIVIRSTANYVYGIIHDEELAISDEALIVFSDFRLYIKVSISSAI